MGIERALEEIALAREALDRAEDSLVGLPVADKPVSMITEYIAADGHTYDLQPLLDEIAEGEGTSDERAQASGFDSGYDVPFAYGKFAMPPDLLTTMTIDEVYDFQRVQINATKGKITGTKYGTSACGKFQIIRPTLVNLIERLDMDSARVTYNASLQNVLGVELLKDCGLERWLTGRMSVRDFQVKVAHMWRSVENPNDGYDTMNFPQPVGTTSDEFLKACEAVLASRIA